MGECQNVMHHNGIHDINRSFSRNHLLGSRLGRPYEGCRYVRIRRRRSRLGRFVASGTGRSVLSHALRALPDARLSGESRPRPCVPRVSSLWQDVRRMGSESADGRRAAVGDGRQGRAAQSLTGGTAAHGEGAPARPAHFSRAAAAARRGKLNAALKGCVTEKELVPCPAPVPALPSHKLLAQVER